MVFSHCSSLSFVDIPNSVKSIGYSSFNYCTSLLSVNIPNSVTSIDDEAFADCSKLASVTIGSGVKSLGGDVFMYCEELADIICLAEVVPDASSEAFRFAYPEAMTLHVPATSINAYRKTVPWSQFGNIVPIEETGIGNVEYRNEDVNGIYSLSGQTQQELNKGLNIIRKKDGTTKKLIVR